MNCMSFFGGWYGDDADVYGSLGGAACDGVVYRSLGGGAPDSSIGWGEVVEAELGLSNATGRADGLSVANIKSDSKKNLVLTQYKKWSLPFGTVPGEDFLHGVVSDLISLLVRLHRHAAAVPARDARRDERDACVQANARRAPVLPLRLQQQQQLLHRHLPSGV
mmetsp:Transcript_43857/g.115934  ORF Transcript_43857/g.115934 Transcript_43857/m.115934 type:complete len:164 (+) Transcript_43857:312-803(+)